MDAFDFGAHVWGIVIVLGPILLFAVLVYAILKQRRLSAAEMNASKAATERLYQDRDD